MNLRRALMAGVAAATAGLLALPAPSPVWQTLTLLMLALVCLGLLVVAEHRAALLSPKAILMTAAALCVVALSQPPHGSHDLWSYLMYGRTVAIHHSNPYLHPPADFPHDQFLSFVDRAWRRTPSVYGPFFTLWSAAIAFVVRTPVIARIAFQATAAASVLACGALLARRGVKSWALAAIFLNPLVVVSVVNGGHNDAIIGLAVLCAALLAERHRPELAGLALAAGLGVKASAALPAAALVLWLWRRDGFWRAVRAGAAAVGPIVAGYLIFGGAKALAPLMAASGHSSRASAWRPIMGFEHGPELSLTVTHLGLIATTAVVAVAVAGAWHSRHDGLPAVLAIAAAAYLFAGAYVLPWYLIWALPVAALGAPRVLRALLAQSMVVMIAYQYRLSHHPNTLGRYLRTGVLGASWFALGLCLFVLVGGLRHRPRATDLGLAQPTVAASHEAEVALPAPNPPAPPKQQRAGS